MFDDIIGTHISCILGTGYGLPVRATTSNGTGTSTTSIAGYFVSTRWRISIPRLYYCDYYNYSKGQLQRDDEMKMKTNRQFKNDWQCEYMVWRTLKNKTVGESLEEVRRKLGGSLEHVLRQLGNVWRQLGETLEKVLRKLGDRWEKVRRKLGESWETVRRIFERKFGESSENIWRK